MTPRSEPLTGREIQILALLADGLTNQQIAARLGRSPMTVKSHLAHVGVKLGCPTRAGMVGAAYRAGVLRLAS